MLSSTKFPYAGSSILSRVVLAGALCAVVFAGLVHVVNAGTALLDHSRRDEVAQHLVNEQLEHARQSGLAPAEIGSETGANGFQFSRTVKAVRADLKQVTVTVTWTDASGRAYSRSGSTYVAAVGGYAAYQRL